MMLPAPKLKVGQEKYENAIGNYTHLKQEQRGMCNNIHVVLMYAERNVEQQLIW